MAVHAIQETAQMTDPAKGFMFELIFENLLGDKGITGEQFELRAQSYTFPGGESMGTTSMSIAGYTRNDAGLKSRGGTWTTSIIETQDYDVIRRFESWLNIMHDFNSGVTGFSSEYKIDIQVNALNAKKEVKVKRKLKRAWPQKTSDYTYGPKDDKALNQTVTWQYDWWDTVD